MKYPMIERLGLNIWKAIAWIDHHDGQGHGADVVEATPLEHVLGKAPIVWFNDDKTMSPYWECSSKQDKLHTHRALLIGISPIVQESEERKLLREISNYADSMIKASPKFMDIANKAKALLEKT